MNEKENDKSLQNVLFLSTKLSVMFEGIYSAMLADADDIFYKSPPHEDFDILAKKYEYHIPDDLPVH